MNREPVLTTYFPKHVPQLIFEDKITPVLLVCVNNPTGEEIITNDYFYQVCSRFGNVGRVKLRNYFLYSCIKILILDKSKMAKALVEFSSVKTAMEALKDFENYIALDNGPKITAVQTQIDSLEFYNEYTTVDQLDSSNLYKLKNYSQKEKNNGFEIVPEDKTIYYSNASTATKSDSSKSSFNFQGI